MKKTLFTLTTVLLALLAQSQNSWYVGGLVGFASQNQNYGTNVHTSAWSVSPEIGTAFNANWSAGFVLGLSGSSTSDDNGDINKTMMFVPDIYGRRWFNLGERLRLFAGLDVSFGSGTTTMYNAGQNGEDLESKTSSFNTNLNTGIAYSLADRWTLLFKLATLGFTTTTVDDNTTSEFGLLADGNITAAGFLFIGVYYSFIMP